MAQTIGYQRGNTLFSTPTSGSPFTTGVVQDLYTNSGTIPMRVILNSGSLRHDSASLTSNNMAIFFGIKANGVAGDTTMVYLKTTRISNQVAFDYNPQSLKSPVSTNTAGTDYTPSDVTLILSNNNNGNTMFNWSSFSNFNALGGAGGARGINANSHLIEVGSSTIWLLPGDVLCARAYNDTTNPMRLNWSIITIADSGG